MPIDRAGFSLKGDLTPFKMSMTSFQSARGQVE